MDLDPPASSARKVKFAPKGPPRRSTRPVETKIESAADKDNSGQDEALLRRVNEHLSRRRPKAEKQPAPVQVAFSHGVASNSIRSFGKQKENEDDDYQRNATGSRERAFDGMEIPVDLPSTDTGVSENVTDLSRDSLPKKKKDYKEPWDYQHSYYPVTLPLRRPYSGHPELLDEAEFGEAAAKLEYDETATTAASDIGLLQEKVHGPQLLFLQLPPNLPLSKHPASLIRGEMANPSKSSMDGNQKTAAGNISGISGNSTKGKEIMGSSLYARSAYGSRKGCSLGELPGGYMGKMLVYKSGAVKLKLGDVLFDVSPGSDCTFAQNVVAVNTVDRHCCVLGKLGKRAVLTPDVDSLLNPVIDLG